MRELMRISVIRVTAAVACMRRHGPETGLNSDDDGHCVNTYSAVLRRYTWQCLYLISVNRCIWLVNVSY